MGTLVNDADAYARTDGEVAALAKVMATFCHYCGKHMLTPKGFCSTACEDAYKENVPKYLELAKSAENK